MQSYLFQSSCTLAKTPFLTPFWGEYCIGHSMNNIVHLTSFTSYNIHCIQLTNQTQLVFVTAVLVVVIVILLMMSYVVVVVLIWQQVIIGLDDPHKLTVSALWLLCIPLYPIQLLSHLAITTFNFSSNYDNIQLASQL